MAQERFNAGYDLSQVQSAFNELEDATWSRIFAELDPSEFAETLCMVSTILVSAKNALARKHL